MAGKLNMTTIGTPTIAAIVMQYEKQKIASTKFIAICTVPSSFALIECPSS